MEAVVLRRMGFLAYCCPKQGQDFKPLAAPLHPNMGQVPPPPPQADSKVELLIEVISKKCKGYRLHSIIGPIKQMQSPVIFMMSSFYIDV